MFANALKTILITSAVLFAVAKIMLFTGFGIDPVFLYSVANEPGGMVAATGYVIGFIIGGLLFLIPFLVAKIRENPEVWYILALLLLVPFIGGFMAGSGTPAALALDSFMQGVVTPLSWCLALVWSFMNRRWITVTKTFPKE